MTSSNPDPAGDAGEEPGHLGRVLEVARVFLKLGVIGFGGPAAHVAMMRDEVVVRRRWVSNQEFLDMFGAVNLLPGPTSTQLGIQVGRRRAGWPGLVVAGVCFIAPAMLLVLGLAALYVRYGSAPSGQAVLYGIKPLVIAIIAQALWGLSRTTLRDLLLLLCAAAAFILYLLGAGVLPLLLAGAAVVAVLRNRRRLRLPGRGSRLRAMMPWPVLARIPVWLTVGTAAAAARVGSAAIFLEFLKLGSIVFGGGYVLVAFLRTDLVAGHTWLSSRQLLDAVSVGQFTPGPVFTTATFIGYLLGGVPGAALATLGIFLPSFVLVALVMPVVPRMRRSPWTGAALDGVNAVALGLVAGVAVQLGRTAFVDPLTVAVSVVALGVLLRWRVNSAWVIAAGAVVGLLHHAAA